MSTYIQKRNEFFQITKGRHPVSKINVFDIIKKPNTTERIILILGYLSEFFMIDHNFKNNNDNYDYKKASTWDMFILKNMLKKDKDVHFGDCINIPVACFLCHTEDTYFEGYWISEIWKKYKNINEISIENTKELMKYILLGTLLFNRQLKEKSFYHNENFLPKNDNDIQELIDIYEKHKNKIPDIEDLVNRIIDKIYNYDFE